MQLFTERHDACIMIHKRIYRYVFVRIEIIYIHFCLRGVKFQFFFRQFPYEIGGWKYIVILKFLTVFEV